ncbi:DUF3797 domain-containing protein, partial [Bacillus thuringiensis]|uniref:DUF3797 domain-containing protein n=1 Tax=Bacillus thuringiensis TaxID=1428 RepID=UPI0011A494E1
MDVIIERFGLDGKSLYYVECGVCKKNRILKSGANVSGIISDDRFGKLCGCSCDVKPARNKVEVAKEVKKEDVKK